MSKAMDNPEIAAMLRHGVAHTAAGTVDLVDDVLKLPASSYTEPERFRLEVDRIFKRLPLMLAPSCEIPNSGDFKTLEVAGVPVLLVRGQDGAVRSFVNSCSHRGTTVATAESGNANRFTCPYHGWTYSQDGSLIAIASPQDFGQIDKSCYGLTPLPVSERAGLIFGSVNPKSSLDIDAFLCGYDRVLGNFNFKNWHFFAKRRLIGPNWKIAYDGYLDYYHLPVLHKNSLGGPRGFNSPIGNRALYYAWGPHQKLIGTDRKWKEMASMPESEWPEASVMAGVWTIFPCISIASFDGGGRGVMISQLLPGETVGTSWTTQIYLMENKPDEETSVRANDQFDLLQTVVRDEDYATGLRQQRALNSGTREHVLFGRNEGGAQAFHGWVQRIIEADAAQLDRLFPAPKERTAGPQQAAKLNDNIATLGVL
jgi:phenylpropionate dioxygenase-like ring-hydroxylating dioxygenase large terminal subunit